MGQASLFYKPLVKMVFNLNIGVCLGKGFVYWQGFLFRKGIYILENNLYFWKWVFILKNIFWRASNVKSHDLLMKNSLKGFLMKILKTFGEKFPRWVFFFFFFKWKIKISWVLYEKKKNPKKSRRIFLLKISWVFSLKFP